MSNYYNVISLAVSANGNFDQKGMNISVQPIITSTGTSNSLPIGPTVDWDVDFGNPLDRDSGGRGGRQEGNRDTDNWFANFGTAIGLTAQWVFYGNQNRIFKNDRVANSFRNSRVVWEARNFWYKKVNSGASVTADVINFRGIKRFGGGNFGFTGLVKAGIDPIEQFVGSTHNFTLTSDGINLTYTITNVTSFRSLMYGLTPEWLNFYNTKQTYIFTEPINYNLIHK